MRQAVMTAPGAIEFKEVPMPRELKSNEILLRIHRIGICGSDVHVYYGKHPFVTAYPLVQGHEYSGEVVEIGADVTLVKLGMKATARPHIVCGKCPACLRGQYNVCQNLTVEGCSGPEGSAQDYFIIPEDRAVVIPSTMTYEQTALVEPVAVGAHSTRRAGDLTGKNVVVAGAGTIGNLVAQFAQARGAKKVLITDLSDFRLDVAKACGIAETANVKTEPFTDAVKRVFGDEGFQVGFEAVGAQAALTDIVGAVENGGTVVIIGVYTQNPVINMGYLGEHELNILGSMMYVHDDYVEAVKYIAEGTIKSKPLITHNFEFEQFLDAYKFIEKNGDRTLKVMINVAEN